MHLFPIKQYFVVGCAAAIGLTVCGCLNSMESGNKSIRPASCNECHRLPASKFCDTARIAYKGDTMTRCSFCHLGSIKLDSTLNDSTNAQIYHDRMMPADDGFLPATGRLHANGSIDLQFGRCTICHEYPPRNIRAHDLHVVQDLMQCYDCHVYSVQCSTDRHPDPSNPADTVDTLVQILQNGIGGLMIPVADSRAHLNNRVDVAFRKRAEDSINLGDTFDKNLYLWDSFGKKSHNMNKGCACHTW